MLPMRPKPSEALMLASFKVSVSQVVIVPFVTTFVLIHSTEAHYIPAMVSDEPTPRDSRETLLPVLSIRLAETISSPVRR